MTDTNDENYSLELFEQMLKEIDEEIKEWEKVWDNPEKVKTYQKFHLPILQIRMKMVFTSLILHEKILKAVGTALNTLPNRGEFDEVKSIVQSQDKKVTETLIPIKEEVERLLESRKKELDYIG